MKKLVILTFVAAATTSAFAQDFAGGDLTKTWEGQIGVKANTGLGATENASYSNVTTFSGFAFSNGGTTNQSGNLITKLVADDLLTLSPSTSIERFSFTVSNLNTVAVSARPRVRFYADNGSGAPGTLLAGFTFNAISFTAGNVATFFTSIAPGTLVVPADGKVWAGMTFDNNTGATGATQAQMDLLGQGLFNPPTEGSSADLAFATTAAGSFLANNPAGGTFNFSGNPAANFGWQFVAVPEPASMAALGLGIAGLVARRRRK